MQFTHEHREIQKTLKRFIDEEINPHVDEWEAAEIFPAHEVFKKMGNLGLLGDDYEGIFEVGDDAGLCELIRRARDDGTMLARLQQQLARRAPLFSPEAERASLLRILLQDLPALSQASGTPSPS